MRRSRRRSLTARRTNPLPSSAARARSTAQPAAGALADAAGTAYAGAGAALP
ncbi:hypothetical protein BUH_0767 [Burkholderia pseudomallei Pakistan 9]|nr:hypothetical protein BUH_0767 [Burkholderia pseudomallei Pakistan 9]